ncbi:MAG: hypothetical protein EZS28_015916, partial [Streblomastix strix]
PRLFRIVRATAECWLPRLLCVTLTILTLRTVAHLIHANTYQHVAVLDVEWNSI